MRPSTRMRWRGMGWCTFATMLSACTLSFDLPKAADAGLVQEDAAAQIDATMAAPPCSEGFGSVTPNLLGAGDFEIDRESWTNAANFMQDTTESRLGSGSLKVTLAPTASRVSYIELPAQGNTVYTLSAWIKTAGVTGAGCTLRLRWVDSLGESASSSRGERLLGDNDWTLVQITSNSIGDAVEMRAQLDCSDGAGDAWFDNVFLLEGNGPICGNLNCELDEECFTDCREGLTTNAVIVAGFDETPITDRWTTPSGTWTTLASAAGQTAQTGLAFAKHKDGIGANDYRVGALVTRNEGDDAGNMGLVVGEDAAEGGYQCLWQPGSATLTIASGTTVATTGSLTTDGDYDPDATFAMEAEITGDQLQCCVHGVPGASLSTSVSALSGSEAGVVTTDTAATFDSFSVVVP